MPQSSILYLCQAFPVVSETFISDQVKALIAQGTPVQVLALKHGNNAHSTAAWNTDPTRAQALHVMYPQGTGLRRALACLPGVVLPILSHPGSWALTLFCMVRAPSLLAQAVLAANWLRKNPQPGAALVCHFGPVGYLGALLRAWGCLTPRMPQLTVFHGYDMSTTLRAKGNTFYRRLFASPTHASVPITRYWKNCLAAIGDPHATFIPLGVNVQSIAYKPRAYPQGRPVRLITVGRLTEKKGQADVLRALAALPSPAAAWEYHLIGAGPQEAELKTLAHQLGLAQQVIFHGALPHAQTLQLLAGADAFLLTSRTGPDGDMEGLPIALMEALASGMPTLSTIHSGIPELITHAESGLLSPEGDIPALTANLHTLLTQPKLWPKLAAAGRKKVETDFDFAQNVQKFCTFLQKHSKQAHKPKR